MDIQKIFIILFLLSINLIFSQTGTISGTVIDSSSGEPLIGANILLEGKSLGAATNESGFYEINDIPTGLYTIKCRFIGYGEKKDTVLFSSTSKQEINFKLAQEPYSPDKVIVVACNNNYDDYFNYSISNKFPAINEIISIRLNLTVPPNYTGLRKMFIFFSHENTNIAESYTVVKGSEIDSFYFKEGEKISMELDVKFLEARPYELNFYPGLLKYGKNTSIYVGGSFRKCTKVKYLEMAIDSLKTQINLLEKFKDLQKLNKFGILIKKTLKEIHYDYYSEYDIKNAKFIEEKNHNYYNELLDIYIRLVEKYNKLVEAYTIRQVIVSRVAVRLMHVPEDWIVTKH